jgi:NADPH-dependent curcumin reductase CurA
MPANTPTSTRQIVLASRPQGWVTPDCFTLREAKLDPLREGDVLVRAIYMSLDPYMRGRMDDAKSYAASFELDRPLQARIIGEVAASANADFAAGSLVFGVLDWAEHTVVKGGAGLRAVAAGLAPLPYHLGALGMPGMTAWIGLREIGHPKKGETLVVSAASGAVGQIAAQMGRIAGCRAVGTAGSDAKVGFLLDELKLDGAFNHAASTDFLADLKRHCPDGIDVYFDNVGGAMLEAALDHANPFARFVQCGSISQYNLVGDQRYGVKNLTHLTRKRIRMEGFIVSDHAVRRPEFEAEMAPWLSAGDIKYKVDIVSGLENAPEAFIGMLKGENFGKLVVQIGPEQQGA